MILIITLIFGTALFMSIRLTQIKHHNIIVLRNFLNKAKSEHQGLLYIKKAGIKNLSKFLAGFPLERYRKYLKAKLIVSRADKIYTSDEFLAYKILLAGSGLVVYLGLFNCIDTAGVIAAMILFMFPEYELKETRNRYEREILTEFPYALDIITVCVEAGLTFDAAVAKYIYGVKQSVLRDEFKSYLRSLGMGENREEALKASALRVNLREYSSFIYAVLQSEKLGTGIAGTIRLQNNEIRIRRKQRVEKLALQTPVKLMLPLVIFILPAVFIVILGPIAIKLILNFK